MSRRHVLLASLVGITACLVGAGLASAATPQARTAVITQTGRCTDRGGAVWHVSSVWGAKYRARHGATRVHTYATSFTTRDDAATTVDYAIKTYSGSGRLLQILKARHRPFDFHGGAAVFTRNVINPVSAPGKARITVHVGVGKDGKGDCSVTFRQPPAGAHAPGSASPGKPVTAPAKPPLVPAPPAASKPVTPPVTTKPVTPPVVAKPITPPATPPVASPVNSTSAADVFGWGPIVAGDEFNYVGAPDHSKWTVYNGPGNAGKGQRSDSQVTVDGSEVVISGDANGTTGGMSAKFDNRMWGRWETRMRVSDRDPQYHPVLILRPVSGSDSCAQEIDYSEASSDVTLDHFFNHYSCSNQQTTVAKTIDMTQWHNYAVQVTPAGVVGYIDGVKWFSDTDHLPTTALHQTIQLDWFPDGSSTRPSWLQVDWMHFYN
jgi:hypothetical protein